MAGLREHTQDALDARARRTGTNYDECRALYLLDPFVSNSDYANLIADAIERDELDELAAERAEL